MSIKVNGTQAKLINEGAAIAARMKVDKDRLEEIKALLGFNESETWVTNQGGVLTITESTKYEDIDPKKALEELKKDKLGPRFPEVVKVVKAQLLAMIGKERTEKLQKKAGVILKWSFQGGK